MGRQANKHLGGPLWYNLYPQPWSEIRKRLGDQLEAQVCRQLRIHIQLRCLVQPTPHIRNQISGQLIEEAYGQER